jgi:2-methylisocitrate lyase-like PEP mutase family enzyme
MNEPSIIVLPGAADAVTARIIQNTGFGGVYLTGAGFSNASFGLPDVGLVGLGDVVTHVQRVTDVVSIPVIVDADTGYGGPLNVYRTVRLLEQAGAAAIQIEDQVTPKRCGHFDGKAIISEQEMLQKIAAALDARADPDLVLIARTDAYQDEGLEGAARRARAYAAAGADVIFVEAPTKVEELERLPGMIDAPLIANMVEGGKTPLLSADELEAMGYRFALFANTALRSALKAITEAMAVLHAAGGSGPILDRLATWSERQGLLGLEDLREQEERYVKIAAEYSQQDVGQKATASLAATTKETQRA